MRTLLQRLRIHLGEVFRPIREVSPELVTPEPEAGGMVGGLSGPSAPGRAAPEPPPLVWGSLSGPADLTGGPPERDSSPAR